ncbi:MFS transporter [Ferrovibrio terrae]|uniref:MFS transporter n=1 Tax=Ferrovibrio terrae TaxID=2594003 RepID=A0A516H4D8_9PROT|nr:MFS transporter [Ferrovibrio terrae]QDO98616.1 MFS transporter [Ferrovibrio terrae]
MPASTPNVTSASMAFVAFRVLLPFACGYFMSYLFRSVNAVIAPNLQRDLGIGAGDLGTLTAAYFVTFSLFQLPLGILLDRYGPRRVQACLLLSAALGAVVFAVGSNLSHLVIGRALVGFGVAGGLMSAMKAIALWLPKERWALANGVFMTAGGLGALAATLPVELALEHYHWTALFWGLAALTVFASTMIFFIVPEREARPPSTANLGEQLRECGRFLADARFWRIAPVSMMGMASGMSIQGLWAGPYLRDVGGLDRAGAAQVLFIMAAALTAGFTLTGIAADRLQRRGIPLGRVMSWGVVLYAIVLAALASGWMPTSPLLWIAFGIMCNTTVLAYPILSSQFAPEQAGRINTLLNGVVFGFTFFAQAGMGWLIALWPRGDNGSYPLVAYQWTFGLAMVLLLLGLAWYLLPRRTAA